MQLCRLETAGAAAGGSCTHGPAAAGQTSWGQLYTQLLQSCKLWSSSSQQEEQAALVSVAAETEVTNNLTTLTHKHIAVLIHPVSYGMILITSIAAEIIKVISEQFLIWSSEVWVTCASQQGWVYKVHSHKSVWKWCKHQTLSPNINNNIILIMSMGLELHEKCQVLCHIFDMVGVCSIALSTSTYQTISQ